ncbi:MAG: pyruvate formate lyase family protein [Candidatus Humimicrobiaceae bacterium]
MLTRIERLKKRRVETFFENIFLQRKIIYSRVFEQYKSESKIMKKARSLAAFLQEKDIIIEEDDLIAGYQQPYDFSEPASESDLYSLCREDVENSDIMDDYEKAVKIGLFGMSYGGHVIVDIESVFKKGFAGFQNDFKNELVGSSRKDNHLLIAAVIICKAVRCYIKRYAQKAESLSKNTKNKNYRAELKKIADSCQWLSDNPAHTFFEALQMFWLTHEVLTAEFPSGSLSPGRFDQFMFPFYEKDLEKKQLTRSEAKELIEVIWIKFNVPHKQWKELYFQNITLGGQGAEGFDATNELSYICLEATEELNMPQPSLSLRYHKNTPDEFFDKALKVVRKGGGLPALFNDDIIIPSKEKIGITIEDARNYAIIGCAEPAVPGKEFGHTEALRINLAKILELMFNNGQCMVTGEKIHMINKNLSEITSFDEFYKAYKEEFKHFIDLGICSIKILEKAFSRYCPHPYASILMEGCVERGRDITDGGAKYNPTSINGCGMANAADSLAAIKKVIFEDNLFTLDKLKEILCNNFQGEEALRQVLINKAPKYGNDDDKVDLLLKDLSEIFYSYITNRNNTRGGKFQVGLYTVWMHSVLGNITGALPDGRLAYKSLSNSLSPSQGRDKLGPTAIIKSITKLDHKSLSNGMVLDMMFLPKLLNNNEGFEKLKILIKTYFRLGGMEIQLNVVDKGILISAQKSPDEYQNLVVRVSGFSAYFVELDKIIQDEIIERTTQDK